MGVAEGVATGDTGVTIVMVAAGAGAVAGEALGLTVGLWNSSIGGEIPCLPPTQPKPSRDEGEEEAS